MAKDALAAHAHDELGLTEATAARPLQAALASAVSFAVGAALPVIVVYLAPTPLLARLVTASALVLLVVLGGLAGGASVIRGSLRVAFWGALAMAASAGVGRILRRARAGDRGEWTWRAKDIRLISARRATPRERRRYQEGYDDA